MSGAIYGAMIHARLHTIEEQHKRIATWITLSAVWSIMFFSGSLLVLINMHYTTAVSILQSSYMIACYNLVLGAILKMQQYFHNMKSNAIDGVDTVLGRIVLFLTLGSSVAVSIWL